MKQAGGCHRQDAGACAEIQDPPGPPPRRVLQGAETALGRAMLAGSEGQPRIQPEHEPAGGRRTSQMRTTYRKPLADQLFRERGIGLREPAPGFRRHSA
jgi:hypothetical protein